MSSTAQHSADSPPQSNEAWVPVLAGAFGVLGAAIASFLSTGFTSIEGAVAAIGSIAPADDRIGSTVGLALILILCTVAAIPVARRQIHSDPARVPAMAASVAVVALVLAFPPTQWLTFGRPEPTAVHQHDTADMANTDETAPHEHGEEPTPGADDEHHEGDEQPPTAPDHDDSDGHDHESDEP